MKQTVAAKANLIALLDNTYPGVNKLFNSPPREDGSEKWVDYAYSFWHVERLQIYPQGSTDRLCGRRPRCWWIRPAQVKEQQGFKGRIRKAAQNIVSDHDNLVAKCSWSRSGVPFSWQKNGLRESLTMSTWQPERISSYAFTMVKSKNVCGT